jgi:predicted deacetylase
VTCGLARLIASCDALVHAGEHETFGLVFLEAMACGIPVIGARSGAVPELVDDGRALTRTLCIAVHDVAPAAWPECWRLLALLEKLGMPPATLLVVPFYRREPGIERARGFRRAIDALLAGGSEVALHGLTHIDDAPAPRSAADWIRRRLLTAGESEFAALSGEEAARRIELGRSMLERLGWTINGFVPPAWLAGAGTRQALRRSGLRYTSAHRALVALASGARVDAPCLTASARSAWRRLASRCWVEALRAARARRPLLRVSGSIRPMRAIPAQWRCGSASSPPCSPSGCRSPRAPP